MVQGYYFTYSESCIIVYYSSFLRHSLSHHPCIGGSKLSVAIMSNIPKKNALFVLYYRQFNHLLCHPERAFVFVFWKTDVGELKNKNSTIKF